MPDGATRLVSLRSCGATCLTRLQPGRKLPRRRSGGAERIFCLRALQADLDLGNYERFVDLTLTRDHNLTTGKVYAVRVLCGAHTARHSWHFSFVKESCVTCLLC